MTAAGPATQTAAILALRHRGFWIGLAVCGLIVGSARGGIIPLEDHREVRSDGFGGLAVHVPSPPFSGFNQRTTTGVEGYLTQDSWISALSMDGVTTADTYGGGFSGSSTFDVVFAVDRAHSYSFHGTLSSGWEYGLFDTPENRAAVLMRGDTDLFSTRGHTFANEGALVPGETYRLLVWAKSPSRGFDVVGWSFAFEVPEPRAAGLVALGLVLLIRLRRSARPSSARPRPRPVHAGRVLSRPPRGTEQTAAALSRAVHGA